MDARTAPYANESIPLGIGYYTVPEAAKLLRLPARNINRWLGGYGYKADGAEAWMPPLWSPELPADGNHIERSFRDLIELRFVRAFLEAGLGLLTIRNCIAYARECVDDDRPFSTRRFQTDGRTILLDSLRHSGESETLDLKQRQYVLKAAIEQTFKDLDVTDDAVTRWRPFLGKQSIVVDPARSFGQPIVTDYGVPTVTLAEAAEAEGSAKRAAFLYDLPERAVNEAIQFEAYLRAR
jgi:uncharacterized protein (DUF433 family)